MAVDTRGWQTGRSFLDCHKYMLENRVGCDVTFVFPAPDGSTSSITAHTYMLRCRSAMFDAMLSGNFREKFEDIVVTDIEPDIFMEVLKYMYYDEANLTCHNVLHVLFAAKKYLLEELLSRCQSFLKAEMSLDNVCTILSHSVYYDETELVATCLDFATSHANSVIKSEDFLEVPHDTLFTLLSNDEFSVTNEFDMFHACMKWAKRQNGEADERTTLGKAFYQIRFLMLKPADVLRIKAEHPNVFADKEAFWLLHKLMNEESSAEIECDMSAFNSKARCSVKKVTIKNRFKSAGTHKSLWHCQFRGPNRVSFTCDKDVWFRGITLYSGRNINDKHDVNMKLLAESDTLAATTLELVSDGTDTPKQVLVDEEVRLSAGKVYTVEADMVGPRTFYGDDGEKSITSDDLTVTYERFVGQNNGNDLTMGQIPQIVISHV